MGRFDGLLDVFSVIFRGGTRGFTDYEKVILHALGEALPADAQARLWKRMSDINLVQRLDGGREVNSYVMRNRRPTFDEATRLESSLGERVLATFNVHGPPMTANSGRIWLVDGRFFSLEFDDPTEHADVEEITSVEVEVELSPIEEGGTRLD